MQEFTVNALTSYRTSLLTERRAASFARCLANNPRFGWVRLCHSSRARGERQWYVTFEPSSEARREFLLQRQRDARTGRAAAEQFEFFADGETPGLFYCLSHTGQIYACTTSSCECGDWNYRGQYTSTPCKHQLALLASLEDGEAQEPVQPKPASTFNEAEFNRIFGAAS